MRQPILYAEQIWLKQRFWALFLVVVGAAATGLLYFQLHRLDGNTIIWLAYVPSGLLLVALLQLYRHRSHAEAREAGLHVSTFTSGVTIPYEWIRGTRVQPLKAHYPETRRRLVNSTTRPLMERPALFVRLRGEPQEVAYYARKLGSRLFYDGQVALPVADPDALAWEIGSHLPEKAQVNMGGGRRGKRRR